MFPEPDSPSNLAEYSVSELSGSIKRTVEQAFDQVRVRGEISGFRGQHSSGHAYFSLKDDRARIDAVVWKGSYPRLKFKPEEGMEVIATGRITTFPGSSKYQIVIEQMEPAGAGADFGADGALARPADRTVGSRRCCPEGHARQEPRAASGA